MDDENVVEVLRPAPGRWRVDCVNRVYKVSQAPDGGLVCSCGQLYPLCSHIEAVLAVDGRDDEDVIAENRYQIDRRFEELKSHRREGTGPYRPVR